MIGRLLIICGLIGLLTSCGNDQTYKIEGKLSNLQDSVLYAVFENEDVKVIDTVVVSKSGEFTIKLKQGDFTEATLFYDDKTHWVTCFIEKGQTVKISGDATYPALLQIKGGAVNNRLSVIKKEMAPLLKEQTDLIRQLNRSSISDTANPIEDTEMVSKLVNINHQLLEHAAQTIRKYPTEEASVILIRRYFVDPDDTRTMDELLAVLSPDLDNHYQVKSLKEYSSRAKRTALNAEAPDFQVRNIYGQSLSLDSFPDTYILLTFTAPWCDMCHTDNLYLDDIANQYEAGQVQQVLVSLADYQNAVREMLAKDSIRWNLVTDSAGQAVRLIDLYNVSAIPRCFLIDENKRIILKTDNGMEIKQVLNDLLSE